MSEARPPGWFDDPWAAGQTRFWDGTRWTHDTRRVGPAAPVPVVPEPGPRRPIPPLTARQQRRTRRALWREASRLLGEPVTAGVVVTSHGERQAIVTTPARLVIFDVTESVLGARRLGALAVSVPHASVHEIEVEDGPSLVRRDGVVCLDGDRRIPFEASGPGRARLDDVVAQAGLGVTSGPSGEGQPPR